MNPSADLFVLTGTERALLVQQVVDHVAEAPPTKKAARTGLFFAAGVAALAGVDRETFLNAAAADFDEAKQGAR
jgi:hypothetical protein